MIININNNKDDIFIFLQTADDALVIRHSIYSRNRIHRMPFKIEYNLSTIMRANVCRFFEFSFSFKFHQLAQPMDLLFIRRMTMYNAKRKQKLKI